MSRSFSLPKLGGRGVTVSLGVLIIGSLSPRGKGPRIGLNRTSVSRRSPLTLSAGSLPSRQQRPRYVARFRRLFADCRGYGNGLKFPPIATEFGRHPESAFNNS
jgi:hypothetical protein